jgi:signal transduction histidine kinase
MQNSNNIIYFNFSYFALRLLGKGLYSNHWTAIAELVANGLDAQADNVKIYINMIDKKNSIIEIFDNGTGMNYDDLSEKYALIGKDKREDGELPDEIKKQVMGRKGIGKLAALYLSSKYYLISKTENENESAWCLDASNVKDSDIPHLDRCNIEDVGVECLDEWAKFKTGTMLHLTNVDLTNFGVKTLEGLNARLADFYLTEMLNGQIEVCVLVNERDQRKFYAIEKSIAFKNFYAFFNNTEIDFDDRLSSGVQIVTNVESISNKKRPVIKINSEQFKVSGKQFFHKSNGELTERELEYSMSGWIGIHTSIKKEDAILNDPDYLKNKAYRPNQLRLYVRKKLAVENFLDYIKNTQAFSNYIEGEISFDILDDNELGDIATSNRQGFIEDDERVLLLIDILKPIINYLIRARIKIANQIHEEVEMYYAEEQAKVEAERKKEEEQRKKAEAEALRIEEDKRRAIEEKKAAEEESKKQKERADKLNADLGSEKRRNYFLVDSMDEKQIDFAKRLHMLKINTATMQKTIKNSVMKLQRGRFKEEDAWEWLKKMSYLVSRIQAVLEYGAVASFNTKEEYVVGDVFSFIKEYCDKILVRNQEIVVETKIVENCDFQIRFVPQDVIIIIDNVISNSIKHKAKKVQIILDSNESEVKIDFIDDGRGIDSNIVDVDELFEFGKGFTQTGTGVGLYHIKEIVVNKLHGIVKIDSEPGKGFTLQIRINK